MSVVWTKMVNECCMCAFKCLALCLIPALFTIAKHHFLPTIGTNFYGWTFLCLLQLFQLHFCYSTEVSAVDFAAYWQQNCWNLCNNNWIVFHHACDVELMPNVTNVTPHGMLIFEACNSCKMEIDCLSVHITAMCGCVLYFA